MHDAKKIRRRFSADQLEESPHVLGKMNDLMIRVRDERWRAEPFDQLEMALPPGEMVRRLGQGNVERPPGRRSFREWIAGPPATAAR